MVVNNETGECDPKSTEYVHGNIEPPDEKVEVGFICDSIYRPNKENEKHEKPSKMSGFHEVRDVLLMVTKHQVKEKRSPSERFSEKLVFGWNLKIFRWATSTGNPRVMVIRSALIQY